MVSGKARKQLKALSEDVRASYFVLAKELELVGPYRNNWSHYGKLRGTNAAFHCHIASGRTTYVACWEVIDKKIRIIEVNYVGTHEGAPY